MIIFWWLFAAPLMLVLGVFRLMLAATIVMFQIIIESVGDHRS